ncbi:hypothetical protein GQ44DRAFT_719687 [Phaeosphaeriaceae sp. PMI808]|nr:hypothetical protein GQ44DRAFT_719687 [Phaeosphaeriaceae sp. PMI808]
MATHQNRSVDPTNVVQALVYTLLGVLDATRDLYQTLKIKERRDYELSLQSKGYPTSRRIAYVEDEDLAEDEDLVMDKEAITRQFKIGYQKLGSQFAIGDVFSQVGLQSQVIALQGALVTTLLYGPTSSDSISHQLINLSTASRAASTSSVDILVAQSQRQQTGLPHKLSASHMPVEYPNPIASGTSSSSNSLVKYQVPFRARSGSPVNTTVMEWRGRPKPDRTDTDTTSMTGPTSYGMKSAPHDLYCLYSIDLQRHPSQPLSASITSDHVPNCPHCKRILHLSPGKAWEVRKDEGSYERCFQISNRFVVKCHRNTADGQYSCVLCSRHANVNSVCGDVKALVRHIWADHSVAELKHEEDITEVVELVVGHRRDSGMGYSASRGSGRRSASLGHSQHQRSKIASRRRSRDF